jgi:N-acetylmuramoyl-L-alanine amidase
MRRSVRCPEIKRLFLTLLSLVLILVPSEWALSREDVVIILDPGHGGADPGVVGPGGGAEKDVCLELARRIKTRIDKHMGYRTFLTRTGGESLSLSERAGLANNLHGTLFLSIHLAGFPDPAFRGYGIYLYEAPGAESVPVKDSPNRLPLWGVQQESHAGESRRLAGILQGQFLGQFPSEKDLGLQPLPIYPLGALDMPAVLIEPAVLTNPDQEDMLKNEASLDQISQAIFQGIYAYLKPAAPGGSGE